MLNKLALRTAILVFVISLTMIAQPAAQTSGGAILHIYMPAGKAWKWELTKLKVRLDGKDIGKAHASKLMTIQVPGGEHRLGNNDSHLALVENFEDGKEYWIRLMGVGGWSGPNAQFTITNEKTAETEMFPKGKEKTQANSTAVAKQ